MPTKRELVIELAVMICIGVSLAALGPFGSFVMGSFADRLAYWLPTSLFGYALFRPTIAMACVQAERLDLPTAGAIAAGVAIAALPLTLVILWWNGNGFGARPELRDWFQLYVQVALIGALVTLTFIAIESRVALDAPPPRDKESVTPATAAPSAADAAAYAPFLARLPSKWASQLTALEMEDHYVRAHGPEGSALILMRLRDAEAELRGVEGLRVHRSWWVARSAVEQVVRDGRNIRLKLKGGLEAPVARDRVAALREAGWLA